MALQRGSPERWSGKNITYKIIYNNKLKYLSKPEWSLCHLLVNRACFRAIGGCRQIHGAAGTFLLVVLW
jgi:hypothetical protein